MEYEDVQGGISALLASKTQLLSSDGTVLNPKLFDILIDTSSDKDLNPFNALFAEKGNDPAIVLPVIADATLAGTLPSGTPLYVDSLQSDAQRITDSMGMSYSQLPPDEREKLAAFLFRRAEERPLTILEILNILYPDILEQADKCKLHEDDHRGDSVQEPAQLPLSVNPTGLKKLLCTIIESGDSYKKEESEIVRLWSERGWGTYIEIFSISPRVIDDPASYDSLYAQMDAAKLPPHGKRFYGNLAEFNWPFEIILLLGDIRASHSKTNYIDEIREAADKLLPLRKELWDKGYFAIEHRADRISMFQKVLRREPL